MSVVSKMVEIGAGQVAKRPRCLDNRKNKTRFGTLGGTPRAISPIFLV